MHVLVTGSRHATYDNAHVGTISLALKAINRERFGPHVLHHGEAPGVDEIADKLARHLGWTVDSIPADWDAPCRDTCARGHRKPLRGGGTYCPAAGNYRNADLVAAVLPHLPDVQALAFPLPGSRGTWDCVRRIAASRIPCHVQHLPVITKEN